ncbi:kinase-like domain-containing protein [Rhizophagus diaphanus]|nr:kinase-like domain-containing protein [Rhizophagus diaphanus] [Rhizophagus sp. MUCL 43196]
MALKNTRNSNLKNLKKVVPRSLKMGGLGLIIGMIMMNLIIGGKMILIGMIGIMRLRVGGKKMLRLIIIGLRMDLMIILIRIRRGLLLWKYHKSCLSSDDIIYFYGFTKDPDTLKYMVVMDYANKGNLRGNLTRIIKSGWNKKLYMLFGIISGLNDIHKQNLIHCDFHDGNILNHNESKVYISDLGLCKPVKSFLKKYDIYGVVPFMAPEVLRGNPYTPASDIYSFSMIMWEFTSGIPPFNNRAHDLQLCLSICEGERPEIINNTPQCYVNLMKQCWDENPLKRPSSEEVLNTIKEWIYLPINVKVEDINEELKCNIMEFINAKLFKH